MTEYTSAISTTVYTSTITSTVQDSAIAQFKFNDTVTDSEGNITGASSQISTDIVGHCKFNDNVTDGVGTFSTTYEGDISLQAYWKLNGDVTDEQGVNDGTSYVTNSLTNHWKFNGDSTDSVGSNDGTDRDVTYVTGKIGQAAQFSQDDNSKIDLDSTLTISGEFTISVWCKITDYGTEYSDNSSICGSQTDYENGRFAFENTTSKLIAVTKSSSVFFTMYESHPTNEWFLLTITRDSTNNMRVYKNGVLNADAWSNSGDIDIGRIGYKPDNSGWDSLNGEMDDFRVYDRCLDVNEILDLYNSGSGTEDSIYFDGILNECMYFDGESDYIDCGVSSSLNALTSNFTVVGWIKPNNVTQASRMVAHSRELSAYSGFGFGMLGEKLRFTTWGVKDYDTTDNILSSDQWQHIAAILKDDNSVDFYLNGEFVENITHTTGMTQNTDDKFYIGSSTTSGSSNLSSQFKGYLDDIRVYDRALDSGEIGLLYNSGSGTENTTYQTGKLNNAILFDGESTYVDTNYTPTETEFSVSLWVYNFPYKDDGHALFGCSSWSGHFIRGFMMRTWKSDINFLFTLGGTATDGSANTEVTLRTWTHLVGTYDGENIKLYKDGTLADTTAFSGGYVLPTNELWIGRDRTNLTTIYNEGLIDDFRYYSRALGQSEVTDLYNSGSGTETQDFTFWYDGKINKTLRFNGINTKIDYDVSPLAGTGACTFCCWIKTTSSGDGYIAQQRDGVATAGEWIFMLASGGKIRYWDYNVDYGFQTSQQSDSTVNDGDWHHVCFVRDGTSGYYYIDGSLDSTISGNSVNLLTDRYFAIGYDRRDTDKYFDGYIDDLRIYSQALTSTQIESIYNSGSGTESQITVNERNVVLSSTITANRYTAAISR